MKMKKLKVKKISKRYFLFTLSLLLLITTLGNGGSIFAMLESNDTPKIVSSFEETAIELTVPIETEKDYLEFPETLKGKLVGTEETIDIPVTWNDNETYDKTKAGEYTFTSNSGDYIYEGNMPTAIVRVEDVISDEKVDSPPKEEISEVAAPETAGKVSSIANIVLNKITGELTETPIIDENNPAIGADAKVVVIHGSTNTRQGHATLESAMQSIGTNSGSYVVVFIEDYKITTSDRSAISNHGENASLITFTSKYNNGAEDLTKLLEWAGEWSASTNTTFKDINTAGELVLFSNTYELVIDSGVVTRYVDRNQIYGMHDNADGDVKIEVKSGNWETIASSKSINDVLSGNIDISVSGTANVGSIHGSKGLGSVKGTSTVTIDGSENANVHGVVQTNNKNYALGGTTVNLKSINMRGSLDLSGEVGKVTLNIEGECSNTESMEVVVGGSINLKQDAVLNLDVGRINSPNANVTFAANSKIQIKSSITNGTINPAHIVNNIEVKGANAKFLLPPDATDKKEQYLYIKGKIEGSEKLAIGFLEGGDAVVGRKFVEFETENNTDKTKFDFYRKGTVNPTYNEGVEKYFKYIVYTDYVPDEGYVYKPGEPLTLGGISSNKTDMKLDFRQWINKGSNYQSSDYGKMEMRNLYAKVEGYTPEKNDFPQTQEENEGYFRNFFSQGENDFDTNFDARHHVSVKIDSKVFLVLSSPPLDHANIPIGSYKGYRRLDDGTLSFMFYLKDYGVFYFNAKTEIGSSNLDIDWTYVNKTNASQEILVSYGGDSFYAGKDESYGISPIGSKYVVAFHKPTDPAMFMYLNENSLATIPAAISSYAADTVDYRIMDGKLFDASICKTNTSSIFDTQMGIQWKYDISANAIQKGSGGIRIPKPGVLQLSSGDETFENPMTSKTSPISIDLLNISKTMITLEEVDWKIEHPYEGINVTVPNSISIDPSGTKEIDFPVNIEGTVAPGDYPIEITLKHDGKEYTTEATITVVRDIQKVDVITKNTDGTENKTAITNINVETTGPDNTKPLYKFYDGKLTWSQQENSSITDIKVNGQSLSNDDLEKAKKDGAIEFLEISEDKTVELFVKEYNAEVEATKIGSFVTSSDYTNPVQISSEYYTYAHSGNGLTNIFKVNNKKVTADSALASYNISGTTDSITGITDPKVYVSPTLVLDENKKSIPLSGDIELPANGEPLYILCDYDTKDVSTEIVTKSTTLVLTGDGGKIEWTIKNGMVAGKPKLIQKVGTPVSEFYSSGELNNFEDGHLKDTLYFNGIEGKTSNSKTFANYTNKDGSAYKYKNPGVTAPNNMLLSYSVKHKDSVFEFVGMEKGIYSLSMILKDAQFATDGDTANNSDVLNRYIHMLDPSKFANLTISENRNAYIDASDAVVTMNEAKKMVNPSGAIVKSEFLKKHKVNGATIDPKNGEAITLDEPGLDMLIDESIKKKIQDGTPGIYEFDFRLKDASSKNQATVTVALTIVPDGIYSDDRTRMINASPIIVKPSIAKTLTENDNKELKSVLNIKSWLSDVDTGTLKEEKATVTLADDVKTDIDKGVPGEYLIKEISSPGNDISQVKIKNFEYLIVAPEDAVISKNNDLYIWAQDKIVDTKDTKERMENETDIEKVLKTPDFMNVAGKYVDGTDQKDKTKVEVVSGGSLKDISEGKIGKYVIKFETTHNGITVEITKTLTIIDNDSTWGVNIPKNFMLNRTENKLKESEVELIGEGKYSVSDFTDTFSVDVSINTKNGLILTKGGAEVNGEELESNIGRYKFVIPKDETNPGSKDITKTTAAKGEELMKQKVSKSNSVFKFKTGIYQKPAPIGDYKDSLIFEFTPNGIAISDVKE